jgi:branched-chain amino acid transport system substrate-binding protein
MKTFPGPIAVGHRRRRRGLVAGAVALSLLAAACGSDDDSSGEAGASATDNATTEGGEAPGATGTSPGTNSGGGGTADKEPYKIAYMGPLSGALATLGTSQLTAISSLVDQVNSRGGVNGHPIELLSEDDATDPAKGIAAARTLVDEDVLAIVGPPVSSISVAVLPTTSRADISIVTVGASPESLNPVNRNLFQVDQTSSSGAIPMTEFAAALLGKEDFTAQIGPIDTPSGLAWGENVESLAEANGFTVLGTTPIPTAPGDVTPFAQRLIEGDPEVILVQVIDVPFVTLVQKLRDLGYEGPIVNFQGGSSATVLETLKDPDVYGARTYHHYDESATDPGVQDFVSAAQAAGAADTAKGASLYGSVYIAGYVVLGAIAECGDECTATAVTDALQTLDLDSQGLTPANLSFSEDDHHTMSDEVFWHWDADAGAPAAALDGQAFEGDAYAPIG